MKKEKSMLSYAYARRHGNGAADAREVEQRRAVVKTVSEEVQICRVGVCTLSDLR